MFRGMRPEQIVNGYSYGFTNHFASLLNIFRDSNYIAETIACKGGIIAQFN